MAENSTSEAGFISRVFSELFGSPLNVGLLCICGFLLYKIIKGRGSSDPIPKKPELPKMKKRDFILEQLREFDGKGPDGRILIAVNGKVFDVTRGKRFYGPGSPYGVFAGRDASRGLATFSLTEDVLKDEYDDLSDLTSMQMESVREWEMQFTEDVLKDEYDDLSDLTSMQMDSVREWEMQFTEKYDYVGQLLKPGEVPHDYTDTEDENTERSETVQHRAARKLMSDYSRTSSVTSMLHTLG